MEGPRLEFRPGAQCDLSPTLSCCEIMSYVTAERNIGSVDAPIV